MATESGLPRILVVDDEEAILETMVFTFRGEYEVFTTTAARQGLEMLDKHAPVSVVLSDQRMPDMSGVEFVSEVCERHPSTVRIMLTGFSDAEATIRAINDGHVYAYITKPWEPAQLKQVVRQAVDHHRLSVENEQLLGELRGANVFLTAVMDELDSGAIAGDAEGVIRALIRPVRDYFGLSGDPCGCALPQLLEDQGLEAIGAAALAVAGDEEVSFQDVDVGSNRFRVTSHALASSSGAALGRVIFFREVSHEPLNQEFNERIAELVGAEGSLRPHVLGVREALSALSQQVGASGIVSAGMTQLAERVSRTQTALEQWLDVDDAMAREDYPDAQGLRDRMRIASARWPLGDELPARVLALARSVDEYYDSGEKSRERVL